MVKKSLSPEWNASLDFTYKSSWTSDLVEVVCWDKDRFKKDYLGEFTISLHHHLESGHVAHDDPDNSVS